LSPSLRLPHQNSVHTSPHACCKSYPPICLTFRHSNAIQILQDLALNSKYSQHKHKQLILWFALSLSLLRPFLHFPMPPLRHAATASPSHLTSITFKPKDTQTASPETAAHISAHDRGMTALRSSHWLLSFSP
jgi:hypothetical protein